MQQTKPFLSLVNTPKPPRSGLSSYGSAIMFILVFLGILAGIAFVSAADVRAERLIGATVVFGMLFLAWFDNHVTIRYRTQAWEVLAARTGLRCRVKGWIFGTDVTVFGRYRGRNLTLFTPKGGKGQVPSTRIELNVQNSGKAVFRLRGPFARNEMALDRVTNDLFEASASQSFGGDQRFYIRSQPIHLATNLLAAKGLWSDFLALERLTSVELDGQRLSLDQMGEVTDADELEHLFELLSEMGDLVEVRRKSQVREPLRMAA